MANDGLWREAGWYLSAAMQLSGAVIGGTMFGYWLDSHFKTKPYIMIAGLLLGFAGGAYNFIKIVELRQKRRK